MGILEGTGLESNREFDNSEFQRADCILQTKDRNDYILHFKQLFLMDT